MTKRLQYREIGQFDEDGIREIHKNRYRLKEGTVRQGTQSDDFYIDRARRLYCHEGVDRIILLSRKYYEKNLEKLADEIITKCFHEWKRFLRHPSTAGLDRHLLVFSSIQLSRSSI